MTTYKVPFNNLTPHPYKSPLLMDAFQKTMLSGRFIGGDSVLKFEDEFAEYVGSEYCVSVGNGFDALCIAMKVMGVGPGSKVAVPINTCIPTWAAVTSLGATIYPVFPDRDHVINYDQIPAIVDYVVPVHLYGIPVSTIELRKMNRSYTVIEDACQAHGSVSENHHSGTISPVGCFSFYPTKNLHCYGDGGAIVTNDASIAEEASSLRRYGRPGAINSCLDTLQAEFLRVNLASLDRENETRKIVAEAYNIMLKHIDHIKLPYGGYRDVPNYHQYVILADYRNDLQDWLESQGIQTMIHYPYDLRNMFQFELTIGDFYSARYIKDRILSLPISDITGDGMAYVAQKIDEFYGMMDEKIEEYHKETQS